jgi:outer membrane receptor for ferrienterochelin and colicins
MKNLKFLFSAFTLLLSFVLLAQNAPERKKIKITGTIIEKVSKQPLEYATITFINTKNPKAIGGGITNAKGEFDVDIFPGSYTVKAEFISFKSTELKEQNFTDNTALGAISLEEDATQLNTVEVRAEKSTVEIKLDKKVYNVGQDLLVKGGTVSDVLDNIPSVSVDSDGVVSLRGNDNVRILIDGRPSNAINVAEALRMIPADAIDKVEVVTNPSARYDSEGGGGLLNIILKKGKNQGINGTFIASAGDPKSYGISGNINYKTDQFNLYTTTGYNYRTNLGKSTNDTQYLNNDGTTRNFIDERRSNERLRKGYNANFGMDWYLTKSTTWTNSFNLRRNSGDNPDRVFYYNYDANHVYQSTDFRFNDQNSKSLDAEFNTNFTHKFKKDGHKLTIDGSFSKDHDNDYSQINGGEQTTANAQEQSRNVVQVDYVLPFGKASQFEAGYKGDFNELFTDYKVDTLDIATNLYNPDFRYTNTLQYKEKINALYTQIGTKINKFSVLLGMRWEDSNIDINQLATADFNNKKYSNFNPSAFLTYEISEKSSLSLNYSRRISRPRGRQINPFSNYSSNINIFKGNPELNPALTDAFDLGYLKRWNKLTLSTSMYYNKTKDSFQFIRTESGDFVTSEINGNIVSIPVILSMPINLATEYRYGFEFTLNYSPYKWWKINSNFNFFQSTTEGDFTYTNSQNNTITQNFDNSAYSWFTRLTSKVNLPYKIDWQTNVTYNGPQTTAQGKSQGVASANLGFSKDLLKDKATLALNVQDVFNSRKRIFDTYIPGTLNSHSEMQWGSRQITLSFTYRFNKQKNEKEKQPKRENNDNGGEEFGG